MSASGITPPPNTNDVSPTHGPSSCSTTWGNRVLWAPEREDRPTCIDVLLDRRLGDLAREFDGDPNRSLRWPASRRVRAMTFGATVMPVETRFGDENSSWHAGGQG